MKLVLVALAMFAGTVSAQTLKSIKVDVAQAQVGQTVTATVGLEAANAPNCGLRVRWGDGAVTERRINDAKEMPFVTTHTYTKAGDYTVVADPGKVGGSLGCVGKNVTTVVRCWLHRRLWPNLLRGFRHPKWRWARAARMAGSSTPNPSSRRRGPTPVPPRPVPRCPTRSPPARAN